MIRFEDLQHITNGKILSITDNSVIRSLITDSRRSFFAKGGLFFAIKGTRHDGHQFIQALYEKGVRQFVVERPVNIEEFGGSNFIQVENSVRALQELVSYHRKQWQPEVVGITGSNGKTIIKEWLSQLLAPHKKTVKTPNSYNSQIGVPLSVWEMSAQHELGIFEAGISQPGEMERLEKIIQPSLGIFTNIGSAHDSGFTSREEKIKEKLQLFKNVRRIIYCKDHEDIARHITERGLSWGRHPESEVRITSMELLENETLLHLKYRETCQLTVPFTDKASIENCMHCITLMLFMDYPPEVIQEGLSQLHTIRMRLELKRAINNSYMIDDVYNNDLAGLQIALDFLSHQKQHQKRSIIISDILESGLDNAELYQRVKDVIATVGGISKLIGIGEHLYHYQSLFEGEKYFYRSTDEFLQDHCLNDFNDEIILVKGARKFAFERVVKALEEKIHGTQLEINLDALTNNLNFYRSKLKETTRLMVMVKAFAYGSGSLEIANLLQFHRVDYLGVAYADEGVTLRKNGIYLPVMVMNPSEDSFEKLVLHHLEPEIYNLALLQKLIRFLNGQTLDIHLKLDTGMHRLGFEAKDIDKLISLLRAHPNIRVRSIFSHLAGADEERHEKFSEGQARKFEQLSAEIMTELEIDPLLHLLNSPGILRFPHLQYDMVRLGIGLYGLEANKEEQHMLQPISRLKTIISQIKEVKKGDTVGYGRKGKAASDTVIATIAIGYADGFSRAFSNGVGKVWVNGKPAPVVGNVCMDMTMIDLTGISAKEGDEVEVFGEHLTISEMAEAIDTIPYEILTNVSQRVKRVYFTE